MFDGTAAAVGQRQGHRARTAAAAGARSSRRACRSSWWTPSVSCRSSYRNTIANMMAEAEALNGIFAPDDVRSAWYQRQGHHRAAVSAAAPWRRCGLRDRRDARSVGRDADDRQAVQPRQRLSGGRGRPRASHLRQGDDRIVHQRRLRRPAHGRPGHSRRGEARGGQGREGVRHLSGVGRRGAARSSGPTPVSAASRLPRCFGPSAERSVSRGAGPVSDRDRTRWSRASAPSRPSTATGRTGWGSAARATSRAPPSSPPRRSSATWRRPSELGLKWNPEEFGV